MVDDLRLINTIPKTPRKDKVIVIGRGPSVDKLNLEAINQQTEYDTCTISDAIKLLQKPTYAFSYHYQTIRRIIGYIERPKYFIVTSNVPERLKEKHRFSNAELLKSSDNVYYFHSRNTKNIDIFTKGEFDLKVTNKLFSRYGSVTGIIHFLVGYMGYKKIYYIGFDGGTSYGKLVHSNRKETKIKGAMRDYKLSWETVLELIKHYDIEVFEPLKEFLK